MRIAKLSIPFLVFWRSLYEAKLLVQYYLGGWSTLQSLAAIGRSRRGLVVKNRFNLLQNLGRDLVRQLESLDVVLNLLNLGGTQNDGADVGVLQAPGEGKLSHVTTQSLGNGSQLLDLLNFGLALVGLQLLDAVLEEGLVCGVARVLGNTVVVLAGQETRGQRRPDGSTVLELVVQRSVLNLEALAVEGIVLRLLDYRSNEIVLLSNLGGLHDLNSGPLRGSPVVGKVEVADGLRETLDNLLHGSSGVGAVGKDNVDVGLLQPLQRALQSLDNVLPAQTAGVGLLASSTEEDFGRQNVLVSGPVELLQGLSHLHLGLTRGIGLGSVKGVDAMVPGSLQALLDNLTLLGSSVGEPSTKGEDAHLETGRSQVAELHVLGVIGRTDGRHLVGGG
jgi:hypothetical protein